MNNCFVIVKHPNDFGMYLFMVPPGAVIQAGDYVTADTKRGKNQLGIALCDYFSADMDTMCQLFNTTKQKMRYVTGKMKNIRFSIPEEWQGQPE